MTIDTKIESLYRYNQDIHIYYYRHRVLFLRYFQVIQTAKEKEKTLRTFVTRVVEGMNELTTN